MKLLIPCRSSIQNKGGCMERSAIQRGMCLKAEVTQRAHYKFWHDLSIPWGTY
jgi:hypothetical protein